MRKLAPIFAAAAIFLLIYGFTAVSANVFYIENGGVYGTTSGPFGIPTGETSGGPSAGPGGGAGGLKIIQNCPLPFSTPMLTRNETGNNTNPDVTKDYAVYEYKGDGANCTCNFPPGIMIDSGKGIVENQKYCYKSCSVYGKGGLPCKTDADCQGALQAPSKDIFAYEFYTKKELPVAQTPDEEINPSAYGTKVVYFVPGKYVLQNPITPNSYNQTYVRNWTQGKILLYDLATKTTTLVANTNLWSRDAVFPRIYDDSIVWADGERDYVLYNTWDGSYGPYETFYRYIKTAIGKSSIYIYNIPLQRTTKLVESTVGLPIYALSTSNNATATFLMPNKAAFTMKKGEAKEIDGQMVTLNSIVGNTVSIKVCIKDSCSNNYDVNIDEFFYVAVNYKNPDIFAEKVVFTVDTKNNDTVYYPLSGGGMKTVGGGDADQSWPKVWGSNITWMESNNFGYVPVKLDLLTNEKITMNGASGRGDNQDVSDSSTIWADNGNAVYQIYRNVSSNVNKSLNRIGTMPGDNLNPAAYGAIIVWENGGNIFKYQCTDEIVPSLPACDYALQNFGGILKQKIYTTLSFSNQNASTTDYAATSLPPGCRGRLLQLKFQNCDGAIVSECYIGELPNSDCRGTIKTPPKGAYSYVLCDPRYGQASSIARLRVA